MQERKMSLRTAILTPFIIIMIIMVIVFLLLWQANYDWIAQEQGGGLGKRTEEKVDSQLGGQLRERPDQVPFQALLEGDRATLVAQVGEVLG